MTMLRLAQQRLKCFPGDRRGNVAPAFALMLVPLLAVLGMTGEGSSWFLIQRAAQYTADQAAVAAATAGENGYTQEVASVAGKYNFADGENDTSVSADMPTLPAPCGTSDCFGVTIERNVPIRLLSVLGFEGNATTAAGAAATNVYARAIATRAKSDTMFCITTLSAQSDAFEVNGTPNLDLRTCTVLAPNGGASCTNQAGSMVQGAYVATSGRDNDNCGIEQVNPLPAMDPLASLANSLPSSCGYVAGFPQDRRNSTLPAENRLQGSKFFSSAQPRCGDVRLTGDVTVTGQSVLVIVNGHLDLAGFKLRTAANSSLAIVFAGTGNSAVDKNYEHFVCSSGLNPSNCASTQNGGVLDFSAPASGTWSGVAIYQDPRLPTGQPVNFIASGSSPQFNLTGMVYAPRADVTISGAINHASQGLACLTFFVNSVLVNGTGSIFATPTLQCEQAGLDPDDWQTLQKVVLVQ